MAVVSLQCPNCGGELIFEPSSQQYECPYCGSHFVQEQIDEMQEKEQSSQAGTAAFGAGTEDERTAYRESTQTGEAVAYRCPSCGAEIITDETTAATFCYFCHNPVVLEGRVSGEYLPRWIIPFSVSRKKAKETFLETMKKKWFVKRGFFQKKQIEKLTGVYLPYWNVRWKGQGWLRAEGTRVRIWRTGDVEHTETRFYRIRREGEMEFPQMMETALKKANRVLVESVQPYRQEEGKEFSIGYLSGFQAEKRDIEREEAQPHLLRETEEYAARMLRESVQGYATVTGQNSRITTQEMDWDYVMVPVWTITYRGGNGKLYYFAMNGQTGKVSGVLPIDYPRLAGAALALAAAVLGLALLGGYLI